MWWIQFLKISMTVIKVVNNQIFKKVYLCLKPTWHSCFFFLTPTTQNQSRTTKFPAVEQRQDQHKVRHEWSIEKISFVLIEIQMLTLGDPKIPHKKSPNKVDFPDVIFNFSKILHSLPSTLCLTGELWLLRFIWHYDLKVTHRPSSAMTFVFTQYSFCNSFRHGLICWCILVYVHFLWGTLWAWWQCNFTL